MSRGAEALLQVLLDITLRLCNRGWPGRLEDFAGYRWERLYISIA